MNANLFRVFFAETPTESSSRPERTRISCYAALTNVHVCGFPLRKPHEVRQRQQVRQEIRGSAVEGPAVSLPVLPQNRHPEQSASPVDRVIQRQVARSRRTSAVLILPMLFGAFQPPSRTSCLGTSRESLSFPSFFFTVLRLHRQSVNSPRHSAIFALSANEKVQKRLREAPRQRTCALFPQRPCPQIPLPCSRHLRNDFCHSLFR